MHHERMCEREVLQKGMQATLIERLHTVDCVGVFKGSILRPQPSKQKEL